MSGHDFKGTDLRRRAVLALGLAAGAGSLLAPAFTARAQGRPAGPPSKPRGQVVAGISQEPTVFNPLMPGSEVDQGVWWQVFSPLWFIDPEGRAVPDLAREVPGVANGGISPDGLNWKIRLRTDAKWHDGTPFTAEDVKFTLDLINTPGFRARNRVGHDLVKDITVVAPDEIHWRMERAYSPYLSILALTFIVPKHLLGQVSDPNTAPFNSAPVGTGPFRWGERVAGDRMLVQANPAYHGAGPHLERVVFKYIPDLTALYTQFRTGQVDYLGIGGIPPHAAKEAEGLKGRKVFRSPTPFIEHIALNLEFGPFADKAVREALYLAMDKQARIDAIYYGLPVATESFLPRQSWAFEPELPVHRHDPAKANTLLDAAGWKRGSDGVRQKDGMRLAFSNSTTTGNPAREQSQQLLQQDWGQIGAEMKIANMPAAVIWGEFWQKSKFESVTVGSNFMVGNDPDVTPRFGSKSIPAKQGAGLNTYQYQNAELDGLLELGASQFDQHERRKTYGRIQRIVRDDLVLLPVYQSVMVEGVKEGLSGFAANINCSSNCWNLRDWYWAA
ncbi:ABC transporter substrate-binding protein [Bosea sp. Root381]|uniref:peptide ABC transporter substrate-binding protein n=1 Tax=Bosea sp. Root381 TaxID=1736524 RepID=UPI0006FD528A|nr:peptide ABC transporter substrate-binding protein [Bosea sp. Root381]KRE09722.1 ABC transporter substrate-binding protein [Bosea sp. Root381]